MIHMPVILVPNNIYLMPVILYSSFLRVFIPITQKTNAIIVTRVFITINILNIPSSIFVNFFTAT